MPTLPLTIDAKGAKAGAAEFASAAAGVARSSDNAARQVGRMIAQFAGVGAAALAARRAVADLVNVNKEFESTMAEVRAVTRANSAEFAVMTMSVRKLGATTRYSAKEAGEALLFLSRAGFSTTDGLAALPGTLDLATAGVIELGEAADIASNVLAQFGLSAGEMARVGDVLVATANKSNTNVQQLAEALKLVGPVAAATGKSLEETSAAVGVLGNAGIQASLAGTNLRGVISALLSPAENAQRAIRSLRLEHEDINPATRSLVEIFTQFRDAGLSAADAVEIFGRRNAAAALILTGNVDAITDLNAALEASDGASRRAAAVMENTYAGALRSLKSAWEELLLTLGETGAIDLLRGTIHLLTVALREFAIIMGEVSDNPRLRYAGMTSSGLEAELKRLRSNETAASQAMRVANDRFIGRGFEADRVARDAAMDRLTAIRQELKYAQAIYDVRKGIAASESAASRPGAGLDPGLPGRLRGFKMDLRPGYEEPANLQLANLVTAEQRRLASVMADTDQQSRSLWQGYIDGAMDAEQLGVRMADTFSNRLAGSLIDAALAGDQFGETMINMLKSVAQEVAKLTLQLLILRAIAGIASAFAASAGGGEGGSLFQSGYQTPSGAQFEGFSQPTSLPVGNSFAAGGIATGPASGYPAMLHGTELVTPLDPVTLEPRGGSGITVVVEQHNNFSMLDGRTVDDRVLEALARRGKDSAALIANELARNPNMRAQVA